MKFRVSFHVPLGTPSGLVRNTVQGNEYEADTYRLGALGELVLERRLGKVPNMSTELVICFAPGTWRTITAVGAAETSEASSENSQRRKEA